MTPTNTECKRKRKSKWTSKVARQTSVGCSHCLRKNWSRPCKKYPAFCLRKMSNFYDKIDLNKVIERLLMRPTANKPIHIDACPLQGIIIAELVAILSKTVNSPEMGTWTVTVTSVNQSSHQPILPVQMLLSYTTSMVDDFSRTKAPLDCVSRRSGGPATCTKKCPTSTCSDWRRASSITLKALLYSFCRPTRRKEKAIAYREFYR